jgi:hypothetical protein
MDRADHTVRKSLTALALCGEAWRTTRVECPDQTWAVPGPGDGRKDMMHEYVGGGWLARVCGRSPSGWRPSRLTWATLLELEPGLAGVEVAVALLGRRPRAAEWRLIRATLGHHVGWDGLNYRHPVLGTTTAYDVALDHLRDVAESRWSRRRLAHTTLGARHTPAGTPR